MRMGQGFRTGLVHGGITCVLQTQFSSLLKFKVFNIPSVARTCSLVPLQDIVCWGTMEHVSQSNQKMGFKKIRHIRGSAGTHFVYLVLYD